MSQGFVNPYTYATSAPTVTSLTSGSGTYTTPAGVKFLVVEMVGGGGGGSGSGTASLGAGGAGGNTTFGSSFLTANGGNGASVDASLGNSGGTGGTASIGAGATGLAIQGGSGGSGGLSNAGGVASAGGMGGVSYLGGAGLGPKATIAGSAATTNSGSGGGGAGGTGPGVAGGGGGAGAYIRAVISSPSASYSYAVGAAGAAGTAGTGGSAGGAGAAGLIIVYEYYEILGIPTTLALPLPIANGGTGVSNSNWTASSLTFNPTTQGIVGTTTNNNADAGYVGELQSIYNTTGVVATANVAGNVTSISLSAGDWDVYGQCVIIPDIGQVITVGYSGLTTTSATFSLAAFGTAAWIGNNFIGDGSSGLGLVPNFRLSLSATTTVYLAYISSVGATVKGGIYARRAR